MTIKIRRIGIGHQLQRQILHRSDNIHTCSQLRDIRISGATGSVIKIQIKSRIRIIHQNIEITINRQSVIGIRISRILVSAQSDLRSSHGITTNRIDIVQTIGINSGRRRDAVVLHNRGIGIIIINNYISATGCLITGM